MMKILKFFLVLFLLAGISGNANAQVKDWLKKKKTEAKQKVNAKIDQKSSEGIDKAVNSPEKVVKKKQEKKTSTKAGNVEEPSQNGNEATATNKKQKAEAIEVVNEAPSENGATVILTNIKCEEGKKAIVKLLKKQDGVSKVEVNTKNGELSIEYSSDGTSYNDIIKLINETGFDADGNPAKGKKFNCK